MRAAKKIYRDCLSRDKEDEDEVYKSLRNNFTDPVGGIPMTLNWWRMAEFDPNQMIASNIRLFGSSSFLRVRVEERSRGSDVIVLEDDFGDSPILQLMREEGSADNDTTALIISYSKMITQVAGIMYEFSSRDLFGNGHGSPQRSSNESQPQPKLPMPAAHKVQGKTHTVQGDTEEFAKPPVDLVPTVLAAGWLLL